MSASTSRVRSLTSPLVRCYLIQHILRHWGQALSPSELVVVLAIFDRTILWGKWSERITLRHFVRGVPKGDGDKGDSLGIGLSEWAVVQILQRLVKAGAVFRTADGEKIYYEINFEWEPMSLKLPKKKHPTALGRAPNRIGSKAPNRVGIKKENRVKNEKHKKPAKQDSSPRAIIEQRHNEEVIRQRKRLSGRKLTIADIEKIWVVAWAATYPNAPRPSWRNNRERLSLSQYKTRWQAAKNPMSFGEYLDWCVRNWSPIMEHYFGWMEAAPKLPMPFVLVRFSHVFEDIFSNRKEHEAFWRLPSREHMIEVKVRRGMARENAAKEVDEHLEITNRLRELTTKQAQLQSAEENFSQQRRELERQLARERLKNATHNESAPKVTNLRDVDKIDRSQFKTEKFGPYEARG
jgi:hypothetical protein